MSIGRRPVAAAALAALWIAVALLGGCRRPREEVAEIEVAGFGTIRFRFHAEEAPQHVERFKQRARSGAYDGTTFDRVAPGFLIQGGDPRSRVGAGDPPAAPPAAPGPPLAPEPSALRHGEGSVSMAGGEDPGAPAEAFFIVLRDHEDWKEQLDGRHTIFGQVTDGLDVAQKIAWTPRDPEDHPVKAVVMSRVRIVEVEIPR